MMLPQEAKLRNFTYASTMTVDLDIQYIIKNSEKMDNPNIITRKLPNINIGKMPIMVKSSICALIQNRHISHLHTGECAMDGSGYFIIKGSEKTVLAKSVRLKIEYIFDGKNTTKWKYYAKLNPFLIPNVFHQNMRKY